MLSTIVPDVANLIFIKTKRICLKYTTNSVLKFTFNLTVKLGM